MIPSILSMTDFVLAQISKLETGKTVRKFGISTLKRKTDIVFWDSDALH